MSFLVESVGRFFLGASATSPPWLLRGSRSVDRGERWPSFDAILTFLRGDLPTSGSVLGPHHNSVEDITILRYFSRDQAC